MARERFFDCGRMHRGYKVCWHLMVNDIKIPSELTIIHYAKDNESVIEDNFMTGTEDECLGWLGKYCWPEHEVKSLPKWCEGKRVTGVQWR